MRSEFVETILSRRSIRRYTGEKIGRKELETIVRAGMSAPTSKDTRHLFFIVIDDAKTVEKVCEGLPYAKMLLTAKHAIIVLADLNLAHGGKEAPYWIQDCSATAENILIAAEALGLGACWTGIYPRVERVDCLRNLLGVPEHVVPLNIIVIGHPTGEDKPRDKFMPSRIYWDRWGKEGT